MRFRSDIEGLRAVAIMLVVAAHAGVPGLAGGFIGVDVFFVLSGFLITGQLVEEATSTGRIELLQFYVRRLRRLLPALLLMLLTVGWVCAWLISPAEQNDQVAAMQLAAFWLSNFHFAWSDLDYFSPGSQTNLYLHTWSLGVEEQFYLVWPALVLWLSVRHCETGTARLKIGMAAVLIASLAGCIILTQSAPLLAFYMMPPRAWQFAAGAMAWLLFAQPSQLQSSVARAAPVLGVGGLLTILASSLLLDDGRTYPGAWAILPTLGAVLVLAGYRPNARPAAFRLLSIPPLQWIGRISYSWYLWHWPILLLGFSLTGSHEPGLRVFLVALSVLVAALSHAAVEAPMRHWKRWLEFPRAAAASSLAGMAAIVLMGNIWTQAAHRSLESPRIRRYAAARMDAPAIYPMRCDDWYRSATLRICEFGMADAKHTAVLLGDSHVGQWFPAVQEALKKPGWRLLVMTKSSCPIVDAPLFYPRIGREYTECSTWRRDALHRIQQISPDLLIFGSAYAEFTQEQWTSGTTRVLDQITPTSKRVLLLVDTPTLPFDGPGCLMSHGLRPQWMTRFSRCTAPAASVRADSVRQWLGDAAAQFPNVALLNLNALVCPSDLCSAERGGQVVFRDNQHLTASFAASLAPYWADVLFPCPALPSDDARGPQECSPQHGPIHSTHGRSESPAPGAKRDQGKR